MIYGVLGEYDVSSIRRDIERSIGEVAKAGEKLDSYKNDLDRKLREIDSAFASLERAMDNRVQELQRNAGKSSGYSSYSSVDSTIKSERRKIEELLDKIGNGVRELDNVRQLVKSAGRDVLPKFEMLQRSHEVRSQELEKLQRKIQDTERKHHSEIEEEHRKSLFAKVAAAASLANQDSDNSDDDSEERIAEIREECEHKIAELTDRYERKLASLGDDAIKEELESRIKRISNLLEDKKFELKKKTGEAEALRKELNQRGLELDAERQKNVSLSAEFASIEDALASEKTNVANYKVLLKKRTIAHLLVRLFYHTKRFVTKWWLWLSAGFILICLVVIAWGVFADV